MNRPSKDRVRQSFDRAAATYDSAAQVQRKVCQRLAAGLPVIFTPGVILDTGCGTGYALRLLGEARVLVQPGHYFDLGSDAFLVLSLLGPEDSFRAGLERMLPFVSPMG